MKDRLVVISSFLIIFAFSAVDSSISPLVEPIHKFYGVPLDKALWLISWGTFGIVIGVFLGPKLTSSFKVYKVLAICNIGLFLSSCLFLLTRDFHNALLLRLLFGLFSGIIASIAWWITFHGVSKEYYQAMVVVLMSARSLSIAIGVPFAGFVAHNATWQAPFWIFAIIALFAAVVIHFSIKREEDEKTPFHLKGFFDEYARALKISSSLLFYSGFLLNRICYFGVYSIAGIWFLKHYHLQSVRIASSFFFIGLGEALINFFVPALIKFFGYKNVFNFSIAASGAVLYLFIGGYLPLSLAIAMITAFVILDRIYMMAVVITIPDMFPGGENKTAYGSLNTLTAWSGLTIISWLAGKYLDTLGLPVFQWGLIACFAIGSAIIYYVQYRTVPAMGAIK